MNQEKECERDKNLRLKSVKKTEYSDRGQYRQHNHQQNKINQKEKKTMDLSSNTQAKSHTRRIELC